MVTHVLEALEAAGNLPVAQDCEQLLALTEAMDSQAYAPSRRETTARRRHDEFSSSKV